MNIINSYEYTENNKPQYKVKCIICGATAVVSADELKSPCKCINTEKNDIIGNTYNNLFVYDVKSENMKIKCKCICQLCGQVTEVFKGNLLSGHTKSCGCLKERDLSGQVFGNLHLKTKTKKNGRTYYLCLCGVCGKTFLKREDSVLSATSCGCDRQKATIIAMHEKGFVDGTQPAKIKLDKLPSKSNKSGIVGVNWDKSRGKWQASLRFKGKKYNLGRFDNLQDAIDARKIAEKEIFGNFIEWYENKGKG